MAENQELGLRKIRRALISVSDKTGIVDFASELRAFDIEIVSTGGTAKTLREAGIEVRDVSDVTGFPEMMDGRVKTLHPKIHGGLLGVRDSPSHESSMREHGIEPIDMVVIDLYPFERTIKGAAVSLAEAIEQIDIGGPAMIRSAAKNFHSVAVITNTSEYGPIAEELRAHDCSLSLHTRRRLAEIAFQRTAQYDSIVFGYLALVEENKSGAFPSWEAKDSHTSMGGSIDIGTGGSHSTYDEAAPLTVDDPSSIIERFHGSLPVTATWTISKSASLRYGENPHQIAGLYKTAAQSGIANAELLSGKEMSFNNYVDADAAWHLVCDFDELACAIIKHTNAAGVALDKNAEDAYRKALATDPTSAFGGIVAFNSRVDQSAALAVVEIFTEVVVATDYEEAALDVLRSKKNLRVLRAARLTRAKGVEYRQISGGMLVQTSDTHRLDKNDLNIVTKREPTESEISDLLFAWTVCKHTKSNAIVYARDKQTVGVGAGQMSRVDSVKLGAMRAQLPVKDSVLASDAFFPFRDGLDEAAKNGITAVIQPGGSMRDAEVIAAADEQGLAMVFTGIRHFKH
uniref:Bifunctional purine biosynthesis protein PurH n=1 Tax=uncultured Acidobacteriota bacterium TaxID=171953 RepID=Q7X311_9BACT|nr:putative AICAR transformylase [uncultured Acidobacteriota bacterium]